MNRFVPCDGLTMRLLMLVRMNNCDENENKKNEGAAVKKLFQDLELTFLFDKTKKKKTYNREIALNLHSIYWMNVMCRACVK